MVDRISSTPPPIYPQGPLGPQGVGSPDPSKPIASQLCEQVGVLTASLQTGDLNQLAQAIKMLHPILEKALQC